MQFSDIPQDVTANVMLRYLPLLDLYVMVNNKASNEDVQRVFIEELQDPRRFDEALDLLLTTMDPKIAFMLLKNGNQGPVIQALFDYNLYGVIDELFRAMPNFGEILDRRMIQYPTFYNRQYLTQIAMNGGAIANFLMERGKVALLSETYPNVDLMLDIVKRYQDLVGIVPRTEWDALRAKPGGRLRDFFIENPRLLRAYRQSMRQSR